MTPKLRVAAPLAVGTIVAYAVTKKRTAACTNLWLGLEGQLPSGLDRLQEMHEDHMNESKSQ